MRAAPTLPQNTLVGKFMAVITVRLLGASTVLLQRARGAPSGSPAPTCWLGNEAD